MLAYKKIAEDNSVGGYYIKMRISFFSPPWWAKSPFDEVQGKREMVAVGLSEHSLSDIWTSHLDWWMAAVLPDQQTRTSDLNLSVGGLATDTNWV